MRLLALLGLLGLFSAPAQAGSPRSLEKLMTGYRSSSRASKGKRFVHLSPSAALDRAWKVISSRSTVKVVQTPKPLRPLSLGAPIRISHRSAQPAPIIEPIGAQISPLY